MFRKYGKNKAVTGSKAVKDLVKILPIDEILGENKRQRLMGEIRASSALKEAGFNSLCANLIENLIAHCQLLPDSSNNYYSQAGGFIDYALNRTEAALNLFKNYAIREGKELSEEQTLWQYALFSAALLKGIGKIYTDFSINLYDQTGQALKIWNPLLEDLSSSGEYYSYQFNKEGDDEFRKRLNLILARLLMPLSGFTWLASNTQVLAVWLALLNEDPYSAGTLGAILIRADAIAVQRYLNDLNVRVGSVGRQGREAKPNPHFLITQSEQPQSDQALGIEFIQWIHKSLESGKLMINKAPLFMVPGGLLMTQEMFQLFIRENPAFKNWQAVQNGFLALNLYKMGRDGNHISRFEQLNTHKMYNGIVFSEYAMALPTQLSVNHLHTGKEATISAIELIHSADYYTYFTQQQKNNVFKPLAQLNSAGEWEAPVSSAPHHSVRAGKSPHG